MLQYHLYVLQKRKAAPILHSAVAKKDWTAENHQQKNKIGSLFHDFIPCWCITILQIIFWTEIFPLVPRNRIPVQWWALSFPYPSPRSFLENCPTENSSNSPPKAVFHTGNGKASANWPGRSKGPGKMPYALAPQGLKAVWGSHDSACFQKESCDPQANDTAHIAFAVFVPKYH